MSPSVRTPTAFCLNNLHKASGGLAKHKPGNWLMLDQTKALIAELGDAGIPASLKGNRANKTAQGTYVVKELVYAYAMWISPAFHIRVIRAYDAAQATPPAQPALPPPQALPARVRLLVTLEPDGGHRAEVLAPDANIYTVGNLHELLTKRGLILADPNDRESVSAFCYAIPEHNLLDTALIVNNRMISLAGRGLSRP
jgi:hypothetical protein